MNHPMPLSLPDDAECAWLALTLADARLAERRALGLALTARLIALANGIVHRQLTGAEAAQLLRDEVENIQHQVQELH